MRGKNVDAALSIAAAVPFAGALAVLGKGLKKAHAAKSAKKVSKNLETATPGSIRIHDGNPNDQFYRSAQNITQPDGVLDVVLHGSPTSVAVGDKVVGHRALAKIISKHPQFKGQPIRLLSCNTGCLPNGIAQHLSNKLGVPVDAPNDFFWTQMNGTYWIGPTNNRAQATGSFIHFTPGGNR